MQTRSPRRLRFLHAILAERALPGGERRHAALRRLHLVDCDQGHARRIAPVLRAGAGDIGADGENVSARVMV